MRLNAAASTAIHPDVAAAPRTATVLGVMDSAVYLELPPSAAGRTDTEVIAVLTADAVRLPCGLILGFSTDERSLARFGPAGHGAHDSVMVGNGYVQWTSRAGLIVIHTVRSWQPITVAPAAPGWSAGLPQLRAALAGTDIGIDPQLLTRVREQADESAALGLLGLGPGLTPSGDDVLAGLLLGARAFDIDISPIESALRRHAHLRTTALSARLLRHAAAGECVREVATVLAVLAHPDELGPAITALLRVGHTSGAALAQGLLIAGALSRGEAASASGKLALVAAGGRP